MADRINIQGPKGKPFGIHVSLPPGDTMAATHLLGGDWSSSRWYESEAARDAAFVQMLHQPGNYRQGDRPTIVLQKIDPA